MRRNIVTSVVSRMPFGGISSVRPAALRGAMAARAGDEHVLEQSQARISEVAGVNVFFAAIGGIVMAANTYYAFKTGTVPAIVHGTEAVAGGLMMAGHGASAFTQYSINARLDSIASTVPKDLRAEPVTPEYPNFTTPVPDGARLLEKLSVGAMTVGATHPIIEFTLVHVH